MDMHIPKHCRYFCNFCNRKCQTPFSNLGQKKEQFRFCCQPNISHFSLSVEFGIEWQPLFGFTLFPARPPTQSHMKIRGQDLERKPTPWAWKHGFSSGLACCSEQLWSLESGHRRTAHSVSLRGRTHSKPLLTRYGHSIQTDVSLSWQVCARSRADCSTGCAADPTTVCQQHQLPTRKQRVTSGPI